MVDAGREAAKTIDNFMVREGENGQLVCVSGSTNCKQDLFDEAFSVVAEDSYRLKRRVEMY